MSLQSVKINGQELSKDAYERTEQELTILKPPSGSFELEIEVDIKPQVCTWKFLLAQFHRNLLSPFIKEAIMFTVPNNAQQRQTLICDHGHSLLFALESL